MVKGQPVRFRKNHIQTLENLINLTVFWGSFNGAQNKKKGIRKISMVITKTRIPHTAHILAKIFLIKAFPIYSLQVN